TRNMPLTKDVDLDHLASITHGFVGADLESLAKEAAMSVLRRVLPKLNLKEDEQIPRDVLESLRVTKIDFQEALRVVRPSAMREVLVETPNVSWNEVGGLEFAKQSLKEAVEWPIKNPAVFTKMGIRPPRGILLYGPPGTGKTLLAKAVAKESEANFILIKGPSLLSMWVGESEKGIRKVFEGARQVSPCIIFFDEIDSLASRRGMDHGGSRVTEQVLNQMLAEMDGLEELTGVVVLGATNRPDMLDPAIMRPGRFDRILLVDAPTKEARESILAIHTKNIPLTKDVSLKELAERTEGFVGADLESLGREAAMIALRESMEAKEVSMKHFEEALKKIRPSVSKELLDKYKRIETEYLSSAKAAMASPVAYLG
ncbi:MAG: AAA family ATPase, partial [Nanoarchaeota archaeon]